MADKKKEQVKEYVVVDEGLTRAKAEKEAIEAIKNMFAEKDQTKWPTTIRIRGARVFC